MALRYLPYELLSGIASYLTGQDVYSLTVATGCKYLLYDDILWINLVNTHYSVSKERYLSINDSNTRRYHIIENMTNDPPAYFVKSIENGKLEAVKFLVPLFTQNNHIEALKLAAVYGQLEVFTLFFHLPHITLENIMEALSVSVYYNQDNILTFILENVIVDNNIIISCIERAITLSYYEIAEILINYVQKFEGHPWIIYYLARAGRFEAVKVLLTKGCCPSDALMGAGLSDHIDIINHILNNYTLTVRDIDECLDIFIKKGNISTVKHLLEKYDFDKVRLWCLARKYQCHELLNTLKRDSKYRLEFKKAGLPIETLQNLQSKNRSYGQEFQQKHQAKYGKYVKFHR